MTQRAVLDGTEKPMLWAIGITAVLFFIISRTKFGKALRAVSQNRELARVTGINATRVAAATFFLAGLIAGYAGFVLAESVGSFTPYFGCGFFLITLTAAVAGGLGITEGLIAFARERRSDRCR